MYLKNVEFRVFVSILQPIQTRFRKIVVKCVLTTASAHPKLYKEKPSLLGKDVHVSRYIVDDRVLIFPLLWSRRLYANGWLHSQPICQFFSLNIPINKRAVKNSPLLLFSPDLFLFHFNTQIPGNQATLFSDIYVCIWNERGEKRENRKNHQKSKNS